MIVRGVRVAEKLGFEELERFEQHGAEQWLVVWRPTTRLASDR